MNKFTEQILIVEDEKAIRDLIRLALVQEPFDVVEAESTTEAKAALYKNIPKIILLDWMLPGMNGIKFMSWLRQHPLYADIPVIMLTAKAEEINKIKGLESGADDYITKPFSTKELVARIKTVLRRGRVQKDNKVQVNDLVLDLNQMIAHIAVNEVKLTPNEFKLLHFFMTHEQRAYSREQLINLVWGGDKDIDDRTVDVHIRRLRLRLKEYGYDQYIQTVHGYGYKFAVPKYENTF